MAYISSGLERKVIRTDAEKVISFSMNTNAKTYCQTNNIANEKNIKSTVASNILKYLLFIVVLMLMCSISSHQKICWLFTKSINSLIPYTIARCA